MNREALPSAAEIAKVVKDLGGCVTAGEICGKSRETVWKWTKGIHPIRTSDWKLLKMKQGENQDG